MSQEQQDSIDVSTVRDRDSHTPTPDAETTYTASHNANQLWKSLIERYERLDLNRSKEDRQCDDASILTPEVSTSYTNESSLAKLPPHPQELKSYPSTDHSWRRAELRKKNLWNSLKLLLVSTALVSGAIYLHAQSKQRDLAGQQATTERERDLAQDTARQDSLNRYFDTMTTLLLERKLRTAKDNDEVKLIGHAKTITTLQSLDSQRKGFLLLFLQESKLIERDNTAIPLTGADLSHTNLSGMNFYRSNLSNTNLSNSNLSNTNLSGANLSGVNFSDANLSGANLGNANLSNSNLYGTNFSNANLNSVNLNNVNMEYALLCKTILSDATISNRNCKKLGITVN